MALSVCKATQQILDMFDRAVHGPHPAAEEYLKEQERKAANAARDIRTAEIIAELEEIKTSTPTLTNEQRQKVLEVLEAPSGRLVYDIPAEAVEEFVASAARSYARNHEKALREELENLTSEAPQQGRKATVKHAKPA